jgi:hypothetical protein
VLLKLSVVLVSLGGLLLAAPQVGLPSVNLSRAFRDVHAASFVLQVPAVLFLLFGTFLLFQTLFVRFVFDDEAFEVTSNLREISDERTSANGRPYDGYTNGRPYDSGEASAETSRWAYNSIVNWEFFPSEALPVLVYFKERQSPVYTWDDGLWGGGPIAMRRSRRVPCQARCTSSGGKPAPSPRRESGARGCLRSRAACCLFHALLGGPSASCAARRLAAAAERVAAG